MTVRREIQQHPRNRVRPNDTDLLCLRVFGQRYLPSDMLARLFAATADDPPPKTKWLAPGVPARVTPLPEGVRSCHR